MFKIDNHHDTITYTSQPRAFSDILGAAAGGQWGWADLWAGLLGCSRILHREIYSDTCHEIDQNSYSI